MCVECIKWAEARHDPKWTKRYRHVLRGHIAPGTVLPGEPKRDHKGRFIKG